MMWTFYEIALEKDRDIAKDPAVYQQLSEIAHFPRSDGQKKSK